MNKKLLHTDVVGGYGINLLKNDTNTSVYVNGEFVDVQQTNTIVSLDLMTLNNSIDNHIINPTSPASKTLEQRTIETITKIIPDILKKSVRFEVISWLDENEVPTFTCMMLFDDKVIAEKDIQNGNIRSEIQ